MGKSFRKFATMSAAWMGSPLAFVWSLLIILIWAATGRVFHYSDTWQLVINTATSVVTFLMVFILQYTQTRDTAAMQLKLDELLRAVKHARNEIIAVEEQSDEQLQNLKEELRAINPALAEDVEDVQQSR
jgi:low affinity Fe/Cu permease